MRVYHHYKKTRWGHDVYEAMLARGLNTPKLAKKAGISTTTLLQLMGGRYRGNNLERYCESVNRCVGTSGISECVNVLSQEWIDTVERERRTRDYTKSDLAEILGVPQTKLYKLMVGQTIDEGLIADINLELGITIPALPDSVAERGA